MYQLGRKNRMEDILKFDRLRKAEELDVSTKKKPKLV